ncbi:choice-of-anchor K domain-containing protein [Streptomyces sp. NBC_01619]|uniref:Choice-of-anchor K domain-containing protein n=1 Tax=Streptomyces pratisoli TaxID=3139917 RepID=A0ACC6QQD1_9ACTN|nr:choice-of-anchor K domain-containing protein [Streptomyces sp. NBC_01619]MCX4514737.1 choice-of-anchor K domain-containing protein [Streptomyces sp. NBC_01619]
MDASQFSGLQTKRLAWGDVTDDVKSSYVFEGCSTQVSLDGIPSVIGTFKHYNHVIPMPPNPMFTAELTVTVAFGNKDRRTVGPMKFQHHETPNVGASQEDTVELEEVKFEQVVEVDGRRYDMHVQGFLQFGQITRHFVSVEDAKDPNTAELRASFTPYQGPA